MCFLPSGEGQRARLQGVVLPAHKEEHHREADGEQDDAGQQVIQQVRFHQGGQHADAVDEHVDADGVAQTVGEQHDGGEDRAQHEGVQSLVQVPVEQPKSRPADEDGGAVTEDTHPIQQ